MLDLEFYVTSISVFVVISFQKIYTYLEYLIISGIISGISNYYYPVELQVADIQQNKDYPPIPFGVDKHIITFLKLVYTLFWHSDSVSGKIIIFHFHYCLFITTFLFAICSLPFFILVCT